MAIEKYGTLQPDKSPKRILKGKLLTTLGATGVLLPYPQNPERILENKILRVMPFTPGGGTPTPPPPITSLFTGLQSFWKLDDVSGVISTGATFVDSSGNGNTLTATDPDNNLTGVAGIINNGVNSIGGGGGRYLTLPDNAQVSCGAGVSFSCAIWANYTPANNPGTLVSKCDNIVDNPTGNGEFRFWQGNTAFDNNISHWFVWDSTGTMNDVGRRIAPTVNSWNHYVLTFDATTNFARTYVNGVFDSSLFIRSNVLRTTFPFNIMNANNSFRNGYGTVDECGFWHVVLPQALIQRLYNSGAGLPFGSWT